MFQILSFSRLRSNSFPRFKVNRRVRQLCTLIYTKSKQMI